jgi:hypothetical protein
MNENLKIGNKVMWSGAWGSQAPVSATVVRIEKNCDQGLGEFCDEIPWSECGDRNVVVDLDNGHWSYGYQLKPMSV